MGYIGNFLVYVSAMVGVIVFALFVFKQATSGGTIGRKSKYLKLIDTMSLGQRKTLYIVSTGREKFLIAGDVDKTTLISKLDNIEECQENVSLIERNSIEQQSFKDTMAGIRKPSYMDKSNIGINSSMLHKKPVMTSMLEKISK